MLIVPSFRVSVTRTMGFGEKIKARMKVDLVVVGMFRSFFSVFQMQKKKIEAYSAIRPTGSKGE